MTHIPPPCESPRGVIPQLLNATEQSQVRKDAFDGVSLSVFGPYPDESSFSLSSSGSESLERSGRNPVWRSRHLHAMPGLRCLSASWSCRRELRQFPGEEMILLICHGCGVNGDDEPRLVLDDDIIHPWMSLRTSSNLVWSMRYSRPSRGRRYRRL